MKCRYSPSTGLIIYKDEEVENHSIEYYDSEDLAMIAYYKKAIKLKKDAIRKNREVFTKLEKDLNFYKEELNSYKDKYPEMFV